MKRQPATESSEAATATATTASSWARSEEAAARAAGPSAPIPNHPGLAREEAGAPGNACCTNILKKEF